jgi:RimJ/RimL family protein N-acetyltransferase
MEQRVLLRLASVADIDFIVSIKSDPRLWPFETDIETDKKNMEKTISERLNGNWYRQYIIYLNDERRTPIGEVHIHWYVEERKSWEIGYCIFPEHQRNGYCFEAANSVLNIAFNDFGAHRVVAMCNARNVASYHIMEKLGMKREAVFRQELPMDGRWDDQYFYAILDSEFK